MIARTIEKHSRARRSSLHLRAAILLLLTSTSLAHATCTASPELEARLKAQPTSENYAAAGNWFADKKQFDCAAGAFASAAHLQPTSASLAYLWGLSLYSAGRVDEAEPPLLQARQLDPSDIRPHLALAAVMNRLSKTAEAEAEWRASLAIDPDSAPALDAFSQYFLDRKDFASVIALLDQPGSGRVRTPLQSLNLGVAYAGTAQLDNAVKVLREGLDNDPGSLPIANELALVLMLHGRDHEAFAVLDLALAKHPDDQPTELLYLHALVSSNDAKATAFAHKLLVSSPDQWEVLYLNAVLESRDADYSSARAHLEHSIALNPGYAQSHAELGNVLAKLDILPTAKEHLERAIALGDNDPEVEYDLAMTFKRMGDTAHAEQNLAIYQQLKTARADKVQAAGKAEEADQAMAAGNPSLAASLYREATASDPDEPLLAYKLSRALDKLKDVPGEKSALERAIQLNPNFAEAQNQMGYLADREGDPARAEPYFRAAVRASPSYVSAWINLAATLAGESKMHDAKDAVRHALAIDPDNAQARQLSQALSEPQSGP